MKIVDIVPGEVYAIPANEVNGFGGWSSRGGSFRARGTAAHITEGRHAAPCRVVAVGKFRRRRSGACAYEIVEDYHTTTVHVLVPDVQATFGDDRDAIPVDDRRIGFPKGLSVRNSNVVWVETVIAPSKIVMPWSAFRERVSELAFVTAEIEALSERQQALTKDLCRLVLAESGLNDGTPAAVSVRLGSVLKDGRFSYYEEGVDHVKITCDYVLPLSAFEAAGPIVAEIEDIQQRLSCRR